MVYNSVDNPKMCSICCQYTTSGLSHWVRVTNCHLKQTSCQFGPCTACCIQGLKSSFKDQTFLVQQTFWAWLFFNTLQKGQASLKCLLNLYKSYLTLYRYCLVIATFARPLLSWGLYFRNFMVDQHVIQSLFINSLPYIITVKNDNKRSSMPC